MQEISGWIKEIVVLVIFVAFLELLVPRSSMQNFIRVVIGLVMLTTILKPAVAWIYGFQPTETAVMRQAETNLRTEDVLSFRQKIYEQGFARKIEEYLLQQGYNGCRVRVVLAMDENTAVIKQVVISGVEQGREKVREDIVRTFGVERERVRFE